MSRGRGQSNQNSEARRRARLLTSSSGLVTCAYCVDSNVCGGMTIDHIIPLSMGGKRSAENVAPCCRPCNSAKGSVDVKTFLRWLSSERGRAWVAIGPKRGEPGDLWRERVVYLAEVGA